MSERVSSEFLSLETQVREVTPIGRFAPGGYCCPCWDCGRTFTGDKLARQCFACAYKSAQADMAKFVEALQLIDSSTPTDSFIAAVKPIMPPLDFAVQQALNAMGNIARDALGSRANLDGETAPAMNEQKPDP